MRVKHLLFVVGLCWLAALPVLAQTPQNAPPTITPVLYINGAGTSLGSITFPTATGIRTGTTAGNTLLLQAYDTDTGPAYVTLGTLTAGTTPTWSFGGAVSMGASSGANLLWTTDGGGNIGASGANRPDNLYVKLAGVFGGSITIGATSYWSIGTRSQINAPSDGVLNLQNSAVTGFTRLNLGPATSLFPALSVTSAATPTLTVIAGDGSGASNLSVATGANGQRLTVIGASTTVTCSSGATCTATNMIPAGAMVVGVTTRVTTLITGATSYSVGHAGDADAWGTLIGVAANTTSGVANFTIVSPAYFTSATSVVLTAAGSDFTAGVVRITVHYIDLTAAIS